MCGIFGYVGKEILLNSLVDGLSRLEYRGYDSCGVAVAAEKVFLKKQQGKIEQLRKNLGARINSKVTLCILHTRWATHGKPNKANSHPHSSCNKDIVITHNGIIENYLFLKEKLIAKGHKFNSETDSEVIAHLIESFYKPAFKNLEQAVSKAIKELKGSFALAVISKFEPDKLIGVRKGSPLILGLTKKGNFLASDIPAVLPFGREVIYLKDGEIAVLTKDKVSGFNFELKKIKLIPELTKIKAEQAEKGAYKHFMIKEIFEQPEVLSKIFSTYSSSKGVRFPNLSITSSYLKKIDKIYIVACGTAYHAGYVAKYFLEEHCRVDVEIDVSSEFRYRKFNLKKNSLLIAISQSGETADTLAAIREAKSKGIKILSICNALGSSLDKESDSCIFTLAGPEIGVASTKAYTAQLACLYLFGLYIAGLKRDLKSQVILDIINNLKGLPAYQKEILANSKKVEKVAKKFSKFGSFLFLGRSINFPSALEGALKLKEISYIPAEGYAAGEMKHGPIALIDEYRAVVCIAVKDNLYEKMLSNMQEAKARRGKILAILSYQDKEAVDLCHEVIYIPNVSNQALSPFLVAVCLQLFAYFVAKKLGCEIDQPRNLAKSVTVE